jgi:hypothetical protein
MAKVAKIWDGTAWVDLATSVPDLSNYQLKSEGGLTFVKKQTIGTAVSSVTVNDAFSATYDNYKIIYTDGVASGVMNLDCAMGATATGYSSSRLYNQPNSGTPTGNGLNNQTSWGYFGQGGTNFVNIDCDLINPFASKYTRYKGTYNIDNGADSSFGHTQGFLSSTTSYTSFTISTGGTLTGGTIYVYGYNKG